MTNITTNAFNIEKYISSSDAYVSHALGNEIKRLDEMSSKFRA